MGSSTYISPTYPDPTRAPPFVHKATCTADARYATGASVPGVWITQRQAALLLAELGLARAQARHVLTSGQAGPATRVSGALLYESARVHELASSAFVDDEAAPGLAPRGSSSPG